MKTQKLRELALAATPGRWTAHDIENPSYPICIREDKHGGEIVTMSDYVDDNENMRNAAYIAAVCPANILALIDGHAELLRKAKQYAENWLLDERDDHDREICICDEHYRHIQELFAAITAAEAL